MEKDAHTAPAADAAAPTAWSRPELLHALRKKRSLAIVAPGLSGSIVDVR